MRYSHIKGFFLDLLFPKRCFGCGSEGLLLCFACEARLVLVPPSCFVCKKWVPETIRLNPGRTCPGCRRKTEVYAYFSPLRFEEELVSTMVHAMKYRRVRTLDEIFAHILKVYFHTFQVELPEDALFVPIPLHKKRQRIRGFNQSERIVKRLTEFLSFEFVPDILVKEKNTIPQVELLASQRRHNIKGAFRVAIPELVDGRTVFLLDDVKTTGATLEEAASTLKKAGALRIYAATIAH